MRDRRRNVLHWRLAHSKPLTTSLACSGGPIQCFRHRTFLPNVGPMRDHRRPVWRAVAGPFNAFDVSSFYQRRAFARPPAKCFAWAVGPFETIGDQFGRQWRAHTGDLATYVFRRCWPIWANRNRCKHRTGPSRILRRRLFRRPREISGIINLGPMRAIRRPLYNGPAWAFPKSSIFLHVYFNVCIAHNQPHYVHHRASQRRPVFPSPFRYHKGDSHKVLTYMYVIFSSK
jgi:hypothetical protein